MKAPTNTQPTIDTYTGIGALAACEPLSGGRAALPDLAARIGAAAHAAFCAPDCLCADLADVAMRRRSLDSVPGWRAVGLTGTDGRPSTLRRRIEAAIRRSGAAAWFTGDGEGILVEALPDGAFRSITATVHDKPAEQTLTAADLRGREVLALRSPTGPIGTSRQRANRALLAWVAESRRPPVPGGCLRLPLPAWRGAGLSAYDLWAVALERGAWPGPAAGRECEARARLWTSLRACGARWLDEQAGRGREPYTLRLRRAADTVAEEIRDALDPLIELFRSGSADRRAGRHAAARLLRAARAIHAQAIDYLAEAAWIAQGRPEGLGSLLLDRAAEPPSPRDVPDLIYLARAGRRPYRQLAAGRLAHCDQPQARATLRQLLYDGDRRTFEVALHAAITGDPLSARPTLAAVARVAVEEGDRLAPGALPALLCALSPARDALFHELIEAAAERADQLTPDGRAWLARLRHHAG